MPTPKDWISAMRLRTLPLAASTVLAGASSALNYAKFSWLTFSLILITTLLLQILSNLANDLGDAIKGTDDENRLGPMRSIQSGAISKGQMKQITVAFAILSLVMGLSAIWSASNSISYITSFFVLIGIGAISAAMKYTLGKNPYGYSGLGDVFVFVFFGLVGVTGTDYLLSGEFHWHALLLSYTVGAFSAAVLNLNNLRDYKNDKTHGKNTIVVKFGLKKAKQFHLFLLISGWATLMVFLFAFHLSNAWFIIAIGNLFWANSKKVLTTRDEKELDPELKKIALGTFGVFLLLFIVQLNYTYELL